MVGLRDSFGPSMCHKSGVREPYITAKIAMVTAFSVTHGAKPKIIVSFEDMINQMRSVVSARYHLWPKKYLSRRKHLSL